MPRNSSGTMSGANGPYVSGTTISSVAVNARFADIEGEITDSLSRSGKGGMTAVLRGVDGSAAAPCYSFTSDTDTGIYRAGANDIRIALGGVDFLSEAGITFPAQPLITTSLADTAVQITGNKAGASIGAELEIFSKVTRTAGLLLQLWNLNVPRLNIDYQGLLRLDATGVAAALQPSAMVTAITPDTNIAVTSGAAYWKDACGLVHLKGRLTNNTGVATANFVTTTPLPAGFRPAFTRQFPTANGSGVINTMQVTTAGAITSDTTIANGFYLSLDGITFLAEQ